MSINIYQAYTLVRCTANIATTAGGVTPTNLVAQSWNVNGSSTGIVTYTTAAGTIIQTGSSGDVYFDVFAETEGDYRYTVSASTGNFPGRASGQFRVVDTVFR